MTLLDDWLDSELGDRIDRINHLAEHPSDDVTLEVEGYSEIIRHRGWDANLNAEPYEPWQVAEYGSATDPGGTGTDRYDTAGCVIASGLWLPGTSGAYASTPDNAALDITGDIDLRADLAINDWTSGTPALVSKWAAGQISYMLQLAATGELAIVWSNDGTTVLFAISTAPVPVADGGQIAVRATLDVDNGAAGKTATFYTGTPTGDLSTVTWATLGSARTTAGTTSIFSGTAPVEIGSHSGGTGDLLTRAVVYGVQVRNGIAGTIVANPLGEQTTGTTSFVDSAGRTWTINGTARCFFNFNADTDTSMLVATTLGPKWTSDSDDLPFDVRCSGATVEVTAITADGKFQVFTVTQAAVNGVAKAIGPAESVSLANPAVYAL